MDSELGPRRKSEGDATLSLSVHQWSSPHKAHTYQRASNSLHLCCNNATGSHCNMSNRLRDVVHDENYVSGHSTKPLPRTEQPIPQKFGACQTLKPVLASINTNISRTIAPDLDMQLVLDHLTRKTSCKSWEQSGRCFPRMSNMS